MTAKTYVEKATHRAMTAFGMDLVSIREGFHGGHFDADTAVAEFTAACTEVARQLARIEVAA